MTETSRRPLSAAQRAIWLQEQLQPGTSQHHIATAVRLHRPLARSAVEQLLGMVVARHSALRTRITAETGEPVQVVSADVAVPLRTLDLRTTEAPDALRSAAWRQIATTPFDLGCAPLFRATLVHLPDDESELLLCVHHAVADARSMEILVLELTRAMETGTGEAPPAVQYADAVDAELRRAPADEQRHLAYWQAQVEGVPWRLDLARHGVRQHGTAHGAQVPLPLDHDLMAGLQRLARQHRTTLFGVLLAATGVLLLRHTGQSAVLIGTPISRRDRGELWGTVGPLINTVPLRVDLRDDPDLSTLLKRLRTVVLGALQHHELPFDRLVEQVRAERHNDQHPLFQVMLAHHEAMPERLPPWVDLTPIPTDSARFDLVFTTSATEPASSFIEYRSDRFDPDQIAGFAAQIRTLLESFLDAGAERVSRLELVRGAAGRRAGKEWRTVGAAPDAALASFFEAQVSRAPDRVAIVGGPVRLSYRQLNRTANAVAHRLLAEGLRPEDRVAVYAGHTPECVVAILAVLKAGGAVVPVAPELPPSRRRLLINTSQARFVIAAPGLSDGIPGDVTVLTLPLHGDAPGQDADPGLLIPPDQLAYVLYTSGSTGVPKGVMITHRGVANYVQWCIAQFDIDCGDGVPVIGSIGFDTTVMTSLLPPLFTGQRVHLHGTEDPLPALERVARSGLDYTYVALTPSQLQIIVGQQHPDRPFRARTLVVGGETLHTRMLPRDASGALRSRVINEYGPTETVAACCAHLLPENPTRSDVPIGSPITGMAAYVLDEHGCPSPTGVPGELYIGGAGVVRGYLENPRLTAAAFVPAPTGPSGSRIYRTGDRVRYLPDGSLEFLGRIDHQVKIRGVRVEPGEVQAALTGSRQVRDAVVLARPTADGQSELVAYVVPEEPGVIVAELHAFAASVLPTALVPSGYVVLDALPVTPNGKIDRTRLLGLRPERPGGSAGYLPPSTDIERRIAAIWATELGLERVGATDNFFAIGGHSLAGVKVLAQVHATTGVRIGLAALFAEPTVRDLARQVAAGRAPIASPARRPQRIPLTFSQRVVLAAVQADPARRGYWDVVAFRLRGPLDTARLVACLHHTIVRHAILCTTLVGSMDRGQLLVLDPQRVVVDTRDLGEQPAPAALSEVQAILDAEVDRITALDTPLLRPWVIRMGKDEHLLLLAAHRLVADDDTFAAVLREFSDRYATGTEPDHPEESSYREFVADQQSRSRMVPIRRRTSSFWHSAVGDAPDLDWPTVSGDRRAGRVEPSAASAELRLDLATRVALQRLSDDAGVSLSTTLLAAYGAALGQETGSDDLLVTAVVPDDSATGVQPVGPTRDIAVVRVRRDDRLALSELVADVHAQLQRVRSDPEVPLNTLAEYLRSHRPAVVSGAVFSHSHRQPAEITLPGVTAVPMRPGRPTATAALLVKTRSVTDGLTVEAVFDPEVVDRPSARRILARLRELLLAAAAGGWQGPAYRHESPDRRPEERA